MWQSLSFSKPYILNGRRIPVKPQYKFTTNSPDSSYRPYLFFPLPPIVFDCSFMEMVLYVSVHGSTPGFFN
jgi:hypothetical protein